MKRTKIVCTIGPAVEEYEQILELARQGMNVARLNMSHGDHKWHAKMIKAIKTLNRRSQYSVAIMIDTKGPEIRSGDLKKPLEVKSGEKLVFTTKSRYSRKDNKVGVNYDHFTQDVKVGDTILVDSGMMSFKVMAITDHEVECVCVDGGLLTSRRHLNIQGKSAQLPPITEKDWEDIKFGVKEKVDFIALSFVKNAKSINEVRNYLKQVNAPVDVVAKIETFDAVTNLEEIVKESQGIMFARGDLGAEIPYQEVPLVRIKTLELCKKHLKPVIIATQLLESMMVNPTPTRAEVSDIALAVVQKADAIMLSGETASGRYPAKTVSVMNLVAEQIENYVIENKVGDSDFEIPIPNDSNNNLELVNSAKILANNMNAKALLVFTRSGYTAAILSQTRPNSQIFAFTNTSHVRRRLNIFWGVKSYRINFSNESEKTINRAIKLLKKNESVRIGDNVIIVSDILIKDKYVQAIQIRNIE